MRSLSDVMGCDVIDLSRVDVVEVALTQMLEFRDDVRMFCSDVDLLANVVCEIDEEQLIFLRERSGLAAILRVPEQLPLPASDDPLWIFPTAEMPVERLMRAGSLGRQDDFLETHAVESVGGIVNFAEVGQSREPVTADRELIANLILRNDARE